jgi:antirestriction protein ArdC
MKNSTTKIDKSITKTILGIKEEKTIAEKVIVEKETATEIFEMFSKVTNPTTGEGYSENNTNIILSAAGENGFCSNQVAGFGQWVKFGRVVKKGEKAAAKIIRIVEKEKKVKGKIVKKKYPTTLSLFFIEQTIVLEKKKA